jgi:hypothetical protein
MPSTANEAELDPSRRVECGEYLFVAFGVYDNVGKERHAGSIKCIASKARVQNFDCNVLYA